MILNFSDFNLLESKGIPNSLIKPSDFIYNFISDKIDWWVGRKGPANYSEEFVFSSDEFGFEEDPDFPIKRFKLNLQILLVKYPPNPMITGSAPFYKGSRTLKNVSWSPGQLSSDVERGKAIPAMQITINMYGDYKSDVIRIKNNLKALIRHEMTHLYQNFKANHNRRWAWRNSPISWDLGIIHDYNSNTFFELLNIAYYLMTRTEFDASLAEVSAGKSGRVDQKKRLINKFLKIDSEKIVGQIRNEMSGDHDLEEIPLIFLENYERDCKKHKIQPLKWALKLRNKSFDQFVLAIHDIVKFKGNLWLKKASKIEYKTNN